MPTFNHMKLRGIASEILAGSGASRREAVIVADALVDANLDGHDSHGVVRIPDYVAWMEKGLITNDAQITILHQTDAFAVIDGNWGWGQVVGKQAMEVAIAKAQKVGVGVIAVKQCNHLGRAGDFPRMAAERGMVAMIFLNTHGAGRLVAPWGGRERRLSANPIAAAVPSKDRDPIVMDISTCAIAAGKVKVALHSKKPLPENCVIDAFGHPTTNPADFYGPPEGTLLAFGGHKGYALGLLSDILAGAFSGAGCSRPGATRVANSFLAIVLDIEQFRPGSEFHDDVHHLVDYVKSSKLAPGFDEILVPGEIEQKERLRREQHGISVADETWRQISETARRHNVPEDVLVIE